MSGSAAAMITTNKTGTLNTKAVTASQLATNSPVLPHKMMAAYSQGNNGTDPPALPPRGIQRPLSREGSLNSKGMTPPAVPPKRSSLTRSDLALFDSAGVSGECHFHYTLTFFIDLVYNHQLLTLRI